MYIYVLRRECLVKTFELIFFSLYVCLYFAALAKLWLHIKYTEYYGGTERVHTHAATGTSPSSPTVPALDSKNALLDIILNEDTLLLVFFAALAIWCTSVLNVDNKPKKNG